MILINKEWPIIKKTESDNTKLDCYEENAGTKHPQQGKLGIPIAKAPFALKYL